MTVQPMESDASDELPTAVYKLFGATGQLLYVGVTGDLRTRFAQHAAAKQWWSEVARRSVTWHPRRAEALAAEAEAVAAEGPVHNIVEPRTSPGSGGTGADRHKVQPLTFRPPRPLRAWLAAYAEATNRSVGSIISEAVDEYRAKRSQTIATQAPEPL